MTRVVVTGMGIVSLDRQQYAGSAGEPACGALRHHPRRKIRRARLSLPGAGRADARPGGVRRPSRHALPRRRRGLEPCRDGSGDPRRGLEPDEVSNERTGIIMGSGGPSTRAIVEAADITRAKGPKRVGPYAVPKVHVLDRLGDAVDLVQDQGRQLFDLLGLRDLQPLHRRRLRAHPATASRT